MEKSTTLKRGYSKGAIKLQVGYSGVSMDELKDDLFGEEGKISFLISFGMTGFKFPPYKTISPLNFLNFILRKKLFS